MDGLLNVGLRDEPGPCSYRGNMDDLLPSLPDPYDHANANANANEDEDEDEDEDEIDPLAALHVYTIPTQDGAGAACSSLLQDATSNRDDADDENNSMSQDLSRALEMSSLCSSPPARERHRSSVSTISAILHPGKSDEDETARSLSVPAEHDKPGFLAKASSIFFRRNSTPRDQHTQAVPGTGAASRRDPRDPRRLAASGRSAVKSAAAESLRQQQELEDGLYARVIANFRAIGWCSTSEIESVEYKRSLINAQWDKKISLLSHAQCYK